LHKFGRRFLKKPEAKRNMGDPISTTGIHEESFIAKGTLGKLGKLRIA